MKLAEKLSKDSVLVRRYEPVLKAPNLDFTDFEKELEEQSKSVKLSHDESHHLQKEYDQR